MDLGGAEPQFFPLPAHALREAVPEDPFPRPTPDAQDAQQSDKTRKSPRENAFRPIHLESGGHPRQEREAKQRRDKQTPSCQR